MLTNISERPWFRWALAAAFLVVMFSLPLVLPKPPQEQAHHQPTHSTQNVIAPVSPDERLADYTEALAWFTAFLFLVSAFQGFFLWRANLLAREAGALAKKTSDDNLSIAISQIEDARRLRILEHRPRLRVRNIVARTAHTQDSMPFAPGFPITGQFYVSNIGGVRAHVAESHCEVLWNVNGLPMKRPYEGQVGNEPLPGKPTIAAGSNETGIFSSDIPYRIEGQIGVVGGVQIYVMGWIEYVDDNAVRRRTAFCRQFLQRDGSARFYPVNDPDYEYEE